MPTHVDAAEIDAYNHNKPRAHRQTRTHTHMHYTSPPNMYGMHSIIIDGKRVVTEAREDEARNDGNLMKLMVKIKRRPQNNQITINNKWERVRANCKSDRAKS